MRYKNNKIKTNEHGKRVYTSTIYPEIVPLEDDLYVILPNSIRLDQLSYQYYGDPTYWWVIAHANHIKGSLYADEGQKIFIPKNPYIIENAIGSNNADTSA